MKKNDLEVLFVGVELAPFFKVGGLGDVMGSLPIGLSKQNVRVKIICPFFGHFDKKKYKVSLVKKAIEVEIENKITKVDLYKTKLPGSKIWVYMLKHKLFDDKTVYLGSAHKGKKNGKKLISDIERFVFFSKAVVKVMHDMKWSPDVVHAHDWHAALVPTFIDEYYLFNDKFENTKSLFTIHNLHNQGVTGRSIVDYAGLHEDATPAFMEDYYDDRVINLMKIGILSADYVNTVSPNYAKEILTKEYGEGLEKYLQRREKQLSGIVNGLDLKFFNPATDKFIKQKYSSQTITKGRTANKEYLQQISKLPVDKDKLVFGLVSRLVSQKGFKILIPALDRILKKHDVQVVILGSGYDKYEKGFLALDKKYPDKIKSHITFNVPLAQQIYAGSDFFLMPSKFEPCGLGQMIAMRYGNIPIVRRTGGLKDTVKNNKTGLVFEKYTIAEMTKTLERAVSLYNKKASLSKVIKTCMKEDFSWDRSAKEYIKLYKKLSAKGK